MSWVFAALLLAAPARAQIDPEKRRLLQLGYDQAFTGPEPSAAYLFYYINQPRFVRKDLTLRLAVAPVYLDGELGVGGDATGKGTDQDAVAVGLAGGAFADSYSEVRGGHYFKEESFQGNGGTVSFSFYRTLDPGRMIPINVVARGAVHLADYQSGRDTRADFTLPPDHIDYSARFGIRFGGVPPELLPARAGELSFWYVPYIRDHFGPYGFDGDRALSRFPQLFWTRFKLAYRLPSHARFDVSAEAGGSEDVDRISAYRLGGMLPFSSEFPLALAGYYNGELTASRYALFNGTYQQPLDAEGRWYWSVSAQSADVHFLEGLEQAKPWNSALATGAAFMTPDGSWTVGLDVGYGIDAIRSGRRGAESAALTLQLDLEALFHKKKALRRAHLAPAKPQGLGWLGELFGP